MTIQAEIAVPHNATLRRAAQELLLFGIASAMLSWVAVFNRAPLVFSDSISYLLAAWEGKLPDFYSIFYSIYILPLHQGRTFWPIVFVQGAILAHALHVTLRCTSDRRVGPLMFLSVIAIVVVFSSAPWVSSQLLPDFFSGIIFIAIYLIGFCRPRLSSGESAYFVGLLIAAIMTHLSHVPLAIGLSLLVVLVRFACRKGAHSAPTVTLTPLIATAGAIAIMLGTTFAASGKIGLAKNGSVFLLAKFVDEGHAIAYLRRACATNAYRLCGAIDELEGKSHDELKWQADSPLLRYGDFDALEPEAREIVLGTLLGYAGPILMRASADALTQFTKFQTGDGLTPAFAHLVADQVGAVFGPEVGSSFGRSRQAQGTLPIAEMRILHAVGLAVAGFAIVGTFFAQGGAWGRFRTLIAFVLLGLIWSAVVTGALSGAYDRYLARVSWLVIFAAAAAIVTGGSPKVVVRMAPESRM